MPYGNKKARQSLQAGRANAMKRNQFIKEVAATLVGVVALYLFATFGLGHIFGVI